MTDKRQNFIEKIALFREQYKLRKPVFTEVFKKWEASGYKKYLLKGRDFTSHIENTLEQLTHEIAHEQVDYAKVRRGLRSVKKAYKELNNFIKPLWQQLLESVVVTFFAIVILRNFVFGLYHVPTGSAEPTLLVGDRVWGNNMAYLFGSEPAYDEHVMFYNPEFHYHRNPLIKLWQRYVGLGVPLLGIPAGPMNVVKRVIAKPGDTIEGRLENGVPVLYRNGEKLAQHFINPYPLIAVKRTTGFLPIANRLPFFLNWIRREDKLVFYTYDPSVSYEKQPFYHMSLGELYQPTDEYSSDLNAGLTPRQIERLINDHSEYYYFQTIRSGAGIISDDPISGTRRLLKYPNDPDRDPRTGKCVDVFGPRKLLKDQYWMMGDSRRNSYDSRYWGPVNRSDIYGRASFIIYSIDSEEPFWFFELLRHPIDFWTNSVRWSRIFKGISSDNRVTR